MHIRTVAYPIKSAAAALGLMAAASATVRATPSGLNNIPTGDTVGDRTVAVQAFDTVGNGPHDFWMGLKTGLDLSPLHLEWGLDSHLAPDLNLPDHGSASVMLKLNYAFQF